MGGHIGLPKKDEVFFWEEEKQRSEIYCLPQARNIEAEFVSTP